MEAHKWGVVWIESQLSPLDDLHIQSLEWRQYTAYKARPFCSFSLYSRL